MNSLNVCSLQATFESTLLSVTSYSHQRKMSLKTGEINKNLGHNGKVFTQGSSLKTWL